MFPHSRGATPSLPALEEVRMNAGIPTQRGQKQGAATKGAETRGGEILETP